MKIGIDISQLAFENVGVSGYLENMIQKLVKEDKTNSYVLFFSSMRRNLKPEILNLSSGRVAIKQFKFPPTFLDLIWNKLHIIPIESLIGDIDIFITSDWTEPPVKKAKKATILYDLIVYKYPKETDVKIIKTQKRKLKWVKKESDVIFCISKSTMDDAAELLEIDKKRLRIAYPGLSN